ncbi:hypothetical protein SNE40_020906 [Patella caerulea]|uniref:SKI/SNO/DAC domain-containing protein n=1 Tax=Patella caerulea TaxID=87958 RepID=A0AAN8G1Z1_PATCE
MSYSSPPPVPCNPENNVCKLIEYRGAKIAAFVVDCRELICLPQVFELFLKHLVGGLHTVYTKLKRLDVTPTVCNVEQVRILRGLGAIQPGVNRCKLISCKEFDLLYEDCTNSSARPGRPPKRSPSIHASPETIEKLKKSRLDGSDYQFDPRLYDRKALLNGFPHHPYALGPLPFMHLGHPMMSPPVSIAMASHLGLRPDGSIIKDRSSSESDLMASRTRDDVIEGNPRTYNPNSPYNNDHVLHKGLGSLYTSMYPALQLMKYNKPLNLHVNGHYKDQKPSSHPRSDEEEMDDDKLSDEDPDDDLDDKSDINDTSFTQEPTDKSTNQNLSHASQLLNGETTGISSIETLLLNIQGLLKVAAENARHYERQINLEKAELKMELKKERDMRETIEKQLLEEQKNRVILQRRLKKEKKVRRRMQETMETSPGNLGLNSSSIDNNKLNSSPDCNRNNTDSADPDSETDNKSVNLSDCDSKTEGTPERPTHRDVYDSYTASLNGSGPPRFPYMPLIHGEVQ